MGVTQGARQAYGRVGVVQLSAGLDAGRVGLFSGANRIFNLTRTLTASISTAFYPAMSAAAGQTDGQLRHLTSLGLRLLLAVTLPITVFYLVCAPWFVPWFLGAAFRETALALQVLAPAVVLAAGNALMSDLLRAGGRQRYDMACVLVALAVNLGLNVLLIPRLGFVGPAVATLASQGVQCALALVVTFPLIGRLSARGVIAPIAAALAMAGAWWLVAPLPVLLRLVAGPIVYVTVFLLLGGADPRILQLARSALARPVNKGKE